MRPSRHQILRNTRWSECTHKSRIATIPLDNILTTWDEATGFSKYRSIRATYMHTINYKLAPRQRVTQTGV